MNLSNDFSCTGHSKGQGACACLYSPEAGSPLWHRGCWWGPQGACHSRTPTLASVGATHCRVLGTRAQGRDDKSLPTRRNYGAGVIYGGHKSRGAARLAACRSQSWRQERPGGLSSSELRETNPAGSTELLARKGACEPLSISAQTCSLLEHPGTLLLCIPFCLFETGSLQVAKAGLQLPIPTLSLPSSPDHRQVPPCLASDPEILIL